MPLVSISRQIRFGPGERNTFGEKDRLDLHKVGPQMQDYQPFWDILMQRASRAGFPPAFFSEYGGETGFGAAVVLAAGKDILFPFVEAVNHHDVITMHRYRISSMINHVPSALFWMLFIVAACSTALTGYAHGSWRERRWLDPPSILSRFST